MEEEGLRDATNRVQGKRFSNTRVLNAMSELNIFAHRYAETLASIDEELEELILSRQNVKRTKLDDSLDDKISLPLPAPRLI